MTIINSNNDDFELQLLDYISKVENESRDFSKYTPLEILIQIFNHPEFKPNQLEIIDRILKNEGNTLGIMPTGGGKSLCFQIPALILPNLTIVVSPLIALMKDQIDNLTNKQIYSSFFINSTISEKTKEKILDLVKNKKVKLLYIAPESLKSTKILNFLKDIKIDLFVIDEAHCISTWGQDFRPDYLKLPEILKELNEPPILALTATATKEVEEDIQEQLKTKFKVFKSSFDRPLLYLDVTLFEENIIKEKYLLNLLKKLNGSTIIYVTLTETAENLSEYLINEGFKCTFYHGQMEDKQEKEKRQNKFIWGEYDIIIATIAFGMGIDKSNIRNIIHFNCSSSIANYYQEIGRSGRDGYEANCITLFSKADISKIKKLKEDSWPNKEKIEKVLAYLKNKNSDYIFTSSKVIEYECEIKEVSVRLILHRLEEYGTIKIYPKILAQIQINKSSLKPIKDCGGYSEDLAKIFSCNFFSNPRKKWLVFEEILNETKLNYFRIKEIFEYLKEKNYIEIQNETYKDLVIKNFNLDKFDLNPLVELFDKIRDNNLKNVDLLTECLLAKGCIRKKILKYFGEQYDKENCEMCSNCVNSKFIDDIPKEINGNYVSEEEIDIIKEKINLNIDNNEPSLILLKAVVLDNHIPKKDFLKILTGNLNRTFSSWKLDLNCYGLLNSFKNKEELLEVFLNDLILNKLLDEKIDGSLRITKKGIKSVLENFDTGKHSIHWTLGERKNPEEISLLINYTKSADPNERRLAASALGKMKQFKPKIYEAVPSLILLLNDPKSQVRQYAIKSLGLIQDKKALSYLKIVAMSDEKEYNRKCAESSIQKLNEV